MRPQQAIERVKISCIYMAISKGNSSQQKEKNKRDGWCGICSSLELHRAQCEGVMDGGRMAVVQPVEVAGFMHWPLPALVVSPAVERSHQLVAAPRCHLHRIHCTLPPHHQQQQQLQQQEQPQLLYLD